jgi:tetratricopeptide (TPR) repeat protein
MLWAALLLTSAFAASAQAQVAPLDVHDQSRGEHTIRLSAAGMFGLAQLALSKGDPETAFAIYTALETNPDADIRAEARFRHARQLLEQKRNGDAAVLLRRLLDEKPGAAPARLELARALQLLGDPDAALREVRAIQASGLPAPVERLIDRYSEALRAARPAGASFEIAFAPDSNINRATRSDTLGTIFGDFDIGKDSKARSGTGVAVRGQAYRRLALGGGDSLLFRLSGFGDLYAKTKFNDIALDLAGGPELRLGRNQLNLELGATQRWFGQKPFMRLGRIGATWTRPLGSRMQLRINGTASVVDNQLNDLQDGKGYSGRVEVERALSPTTGIGANLSLDREALKDPGYSTIGWRAGLVGWRDIGRMTFTAEAEFGKLHADERLVLFPDRRSDRYMSLSLGTTFRQLQWRGFAPIARFTIERNRSSIAFYDYRRTRSEIGVVRAF